MNPIPEDNEPSSVSNIDKRRAEAYGPFCGDAIQKRGLSWNGNHLPYNRDNAAMARELRKHMTPQERKLWYGFLRMQPLRFIRQRPVDHYILDFYCASHRIAIEIDGRQHSSLSGQEYDRLRSETLSFYKIRVIRFTNNEIDEQFEAVCRRIREEIPSDPLNKGGA
jgi:very-short-patch-repair endonuclease